MSRLTAVILRTMASAARTTHIDEAQRDASIWTNSFVPVSGRRSLVGISFWDRTGNGPSVLVKGRKMTTATSTLTQEVKDATNKQGKYLTFALGPEEYGLEILTVREIIGYMEITAVPQTPHEVRGVINLRGQVIPVVDLRAKFGMESAEVTDETCIIVVEISHGGRNFSTGIVVDHVQEVLDIAGQDIEEAPQFGASVNTDFILGMGKIGDSVKILLDIDRVLGGGDLAGLGGGDIPVGD
jgi:purine-binding chemotaxis protein CheW